MGELENLGGVLREVYDTVGDDDVLGSQIAELTYGVDVPGDAPGGVPSIDAALADLARSTPPPELAYRRVLVIAALSKVLPERFGWHGGDRQKAVAALRPVTRDGSERLAKALYGLVCEGVEREQDARAMKRAVFTTALAQRTLVVTIEAKTATVQSPAGATRSRLGGTATIPGFGLEDVRELLEPTEWKRLSGGRITMTPHPAGELENSVGRLYDEVFEVTSRLTLTPRLRFITHPLVETDGGTAQWLEYRLAGSQSPGELVKVDQGSIVIRDTRDGVRIATTKRVLLTPPFDAPGLAMQADALGYFDAFEQMVRAALESPG